MELTISESRSVHQSSDDVMLAEQSVLAWISFPKSQNSQEATSTYLNDAIKMYKVQTKSVLWQPLLYQFGRQALLTEKP